ncbi:MAG: ferredoxin [Chloroflexi bacterium]|nr:ferredoxin [Chloroflexota bacterium]|tara:strand:+ start:4548 stop:4790 length:243 start_codon:yes stop_codon:yes gene_type:complete
MTYVICEPCIGTKDASCVDVCPVDCIHTTDEAEVYYIDPDECIDCGACEPVCPVTAIFPDFDVPEEWANWTKVNADFFTD